mmetsp:Transcript_3314/g.4899  ORF Transcript_3314/g.4899 Transcript_3314/m.4899 type:complete len:425 (+) Transcript_3314:601-1875(+)
MKRIFQNTIKRTLKPRIVQNQLKRNYQTLSDLQKQDFNEFQNELRDTVQQFAEAKIKPIAAQMDQTDKIPDMKELWQEMGELGLHGITVQEKDGGLDLGILDHVIVVEELSRYSAAVGVSYGAHSNLCIDRIAKVGNKEQKDKYLPKLLSGEHIGALAMSEPAAGSDITSMTLKAKEDDEGNFILNGSKFWITNGAVADVTVVYAKTGGGKYGITAFIVEKDFEGFSVGQKIDKCGIRGSPTSELVFENCKVPKENVLGGIDKGVHVLMSGLDYERIIAAGGSLGIMQGCIDTVIPYIHERKQFGQEIANFQLMQGRVADMYTNLNACRYYVYGVARACDRLEEGGSSLPLRKDAAGCLLYASQKATDVAGEACVALGGMGYTKEFPVEKMWRDAKIFEIFAGTVDIRKILLAGEISQDYRRNH